MSKHRLTLRCPAALTRHCLRPADLIAVLGLVVALAPAVGCQTDIQHNLQESEANEIAVLLESNGIAASKQSVGRTAEWVVSVPTAEASRAWQVLAAHGLPRRPIDGFEETFGEPSLIPSPIEERVRLQQATAGQLELSLMAMDRVVDARVHLVIPTREPLSSRSNEIEAPQAAVLIVFRDGDDDRPPVSVDAVRRLVAGAVSGLTPDSISVVTTPRPAPVLEESQRFARLGPLVVATSSRQTLQILFGALGGLILLLSAVIVILVLKRRRPAPS